MKKKVGKILQAVAAIAVLLLMLGWIAGVFHSKVRPGDETPQAAADQGAQSITVERVVVPSYYEALGTVHSRTEVTISSRVPGTIRQILVEEGDSVRSGELLVTLDAPELSAATYSAVGQVDAAQSALAQAQRDFERYEELYNRGIVSRQQYEQMKTAVEVAEGNLSAARGGASQAGSVASYTRIESPSSGVVALKYLEEGDVVGPGTPILLIHDPQSLRLEAAVDESVA